MKIRIHKPIYGVPISFFSKYNSDQFEIIGITYSKDKNPDIELIRTSYKKRHTPFINEKEIYIRLIIRNI